ncbi:hypothetical protein ACPOL_3131 [Acidisarcina polymorpha]|uniref:Uncharacterized protein n=1 Tax=Acidisarcina polymorpha TaxID=2211140 RepID=A0A2Z5G1J0_9BACT|nr:hypothetical protein ACPOL_3131 [Acidisarcina polymorpha]
MTIQKLLKKKFCVLCVAFHYGNPFLYRVCEMTESKQTAMSNDRSTAGWPPFSY